MKPLEDIRIIAIEQYGAGPWGSLHLADLGADVIKIEDARTGGDISRYVPPFQAEEDSLYFEAFNRNKKSLSLDLTQPAGRQVFEDLVRVSDVVYSNLRGDVPEKLGILYDQLAHLNERIVCCSLSAYGTTGPRRRDPGYDYVMQGLAGWMTLTGEPAGPPAKSGLSMVDFSGGFVAALAILAGVHAARRDGRGMDCDVSLFDTAISLLNYPAIWLLNGGLTPRRMSHSAHPSLVPFGNFPTADGWIVIACAKEKFWQRLTVALEEPALAADPRFRDFSARDDNREVLIPLLNEAFQRRETHEWVTVLTAAGVPVAPVNDVSTALDDPQTQARGLIVETEHPRFGVVRQLASAVRVGDDDQVTYHRAPRRHEDAPWVLEELLGYAKEHIESLQTQGAFG